ncbi:hypothetical protein CC78DRAFT_611377 [Lojkania enalia]|uniref:SMP domain-containing protein n=1 Tax=Lojkania enalia TaxID=147567 RepID=A0A9P4NC32_9PLEO|nr:hypothetical protein CC78DRAFT_611377 [Didymosphaeria enalia]
MASTSNRHHSKLVQGHKSTGSPKVDFHSFFQEVLEKLQKNPLAITAEDARRLHEHFDATDERSAKIISAIEALALAQPDIMATSNGKIEAAAPSPPKVCLLTLVNDLAATVDANPDGVSPEVLESTQRVVSKMQKAIGHTNAPHPELEGELQEEFAQIKPKVEKGIVTKEEADHLHSLEARAHGHTEKGGLTAMAQSVAARRERSLSQEKQEHLLCQEIAKTEPKIESHTVTKGEAAHLNSLETKAYGHAQKGGVVATAQSVSAKEEALREAAVKIEPKIKDGTVTNKEADHLHALEVRAHGHTEKGGLAATAQSIAAKRERRKSLSNASNSHQKSPSNAANSQVAPSKDHEAKAGVQHVEGVDIPLRPKAEVGVENTAH